MPGNLHTAGMVFQDGETWLFWTASTDNNAPASRIVYRVLVNGIEDHSLLGHTRAILYVPVGQTNRSTSSPWTRRATNRSRPRYS